MFKDTPDGQTHSFGKCSCGACHEQLETHTQPNIIKEQEDWQATQSNDPIEVQLIIACHDDMVRVTPTKVAEVKRILDRYRSQLLQEIEEGIQGFDWKCDMNFYDGGLTWGEKRLARLITLITSFK